MSALQAQELRLDVSQVLDRVQHGILDRSARVQLLEGRLIQMAPQGFVHLWTTSALAAALREVYGPAHAVLEEQPLQLDSHNLPEPDVAVLTEPLGALRGIPTGSQTLLVAEVAWTSQSLDREKARLYAAAGVSHYWLVDAKQRLVRAFSEPGPDGYERVATLRAPDTLTPPGAAEVIAIASLFPAD